MKPDRFMWECCGIRFANSATMRGTVEGPLPSDVSSAGSPKTAAPPSQASWSYGFSEAALPTGRRCTSWQSIAALGSAEGLLRNGASFGTLAAARA